MLKAKIRSSVHTDSLCERRMWTRWTSNKFQVWKDLALIFMQKTTGLNNHWLLQKVFPKYILDCSIF